MKVLVTGGAGFIGSHVVDLLVKKGFRVSVVDDLSTGRFENLNPRVTFYRIGVESPDLRVAFDLERPGAVLHLAAQVNVQRSLEEPQADAEINILGTINLLEACRRFEVGKVVYASSAAVYGSPAYLPVDEKHPVEPQSPYGASKYIVEHYLRMYQKAYGIRHTVLRYANVYGPRQDATGEGGVVASFVNKLFLGEAPKIFGDGEQTRDFIYVADVAAANLAALHRGDGMILNVSTGARLSVNELYRILKKITGSALDPESRPPRPGDILHSCLANEKAREALGWSPLYGLEEGLRETVRYDQP